MAEDLLTGVMYGRRCSERQGIYRDTFNKNDVDDRNDFLETHIPLVINEARKIMESYKRSDEVVLDDLIQEGMMGLIRAADKFDQDRGIRFSTYATGWIMSSIKKYLGDRNIIPKGVVFYQKFHKLTRAIDDLRSEIERDPTIDEIANYVGQDIDVINSLLQYSDDVRQHNDSIESVSAVLDYVVNDVSSIGDILIDRVDVREIVDFLLDNLSDRERKVIECRCGLKYTDGASFKEIGKVLGVTPERVRQIEEDALDKMRLVCMIEGIDVAELV